MERDKPSEIEKEFRYGRDHINDFDLDSDEFCRHHDEVMSELGKCPVAHSKVGAGYTIVTKYDDVRRVAMDWRTYTSQHGFWPNRPPDMPWFQLIESDPPFHTAWRKSLSPYFSVEACEKLAPTIRAIIDRSIDAVIERGTMDFVEDIVKPLPVEIFFRELLPLPEDDFDRVVGYASDGFVGPVEGRAAAWARCADYVDWYLKQRALQPPRGDMVDAIVKGINIGDVTPYVHGMSPDEVRVSIVTNLISGSVDNIIYSLASIFYHLAQHPEDRRMLASHPEKISHAIEEALRFFSPNPMIGRTCTADANIGGAEQRPGDYVMIGWGAANRDPAIFENPDQLDFERPEANRHVAFGYGPHRCIGINLARVQIRVAMEQILARIPEFELIEGTTPSYSCGLVHEMHGLHLSFPPAPGKLA